MSVTIQIPRKFNIPSFLHCDPTAVEGKPVSEQTLAPLEECAADGYPVKDTSETSYKTPDPASKGSMGGRAGSIQGGTCKGADQACRPPLSMDVSFRSGQLCLLASFPYSNLSIQEGECCPLLSRHGAQVLKHQSYTVRTT